MSTFFKIIATLLLLAGFVWAAKIGIEKQDRADCHKWQEQAKEIKEFYLTQSQRNQCDYWDIKVDAPVKIIRE